MEKNEARFERPSWWWYTRIGIGLVAAVVLLWLLLGFVWFASFSVEREPGTFGDSFGMVNALFSGLAFAGVVLAIIIQIVELRVTWEEIEDSRIAQQRTAQQQAYAATVAAITSLNDMVRRQSAHKDGITNYLHHATLCRREYQQRRVLEVLVSRILKEQSDVAVEDTSMFTADLRADMDRRMGLGFILLSHAEKAESFRVQLSTPTNRTNGEFRIEVTSLLDELRGSLNQDSQGLKSLCHTGLQSCSIPMKSMLEWLDVDHEYAIAHGDLGYFVRRLEEYRDDLCRSTIYAVECEVFE